MIRIDGTNIRLKRGDSARIRINMNDENGDPYPREADDVIKIQVRKKIGDGDIVIEGDISFDDDGILWEIKPEDTFELTNGVYYWDCEIERGNGDVFTFIPYSKFAIINDSEIINNLPKEYRTAELFVDLYGAGSFGEIDPSELTLQMIIDTMTWQLKKEEWIAGLVAGAADLASRKENLRAKWWSQFAKGDLPSLQRIADAYKNGSIALSYAYPVITIRFTSAAGVPRDLPELKKRLREVAPAHLGLDYVIIYQTHKDLKVYTHQQLHARTHSGIRNGEV